MRLLLIFSEKSGHFYHFKVLWLSRVSLVFANLGRILLRLAACWSKFSFENGNLIQLEIGVISTMISSHFCQHLHVGLVFRTPSTTFAFIWLHFYFKYDETDISGDYYTYINNILISASSAIQYYRN